MPLLILDESQRLNLHLMMGQQRGTLNEIRVFWKVQDKIALSDEDRTHIDFKVVQNNGNSVTSWNQLKVTPQEFEFSSEELDNLIKMFKEWQYGFTAIDRTWLEPLLAQLDNIEAQKGK